VRKWKKEEGKIETHYDMKKKEKEKQHQKVCVEERIILIEVPFLGQ
jgi:hypothetical protein